jgi:flagella synthesis protein FlgN
MIAHAQAELEEALHSVVADMQSATHELIDILDEEYQSLLSADISGLNCAGEAKQLLMRRLEQLDEERLHLSFTSPKSATSVQTAWDELLTQLAACKKKNNQNGALAGQRLQQVRRALAVLTDSSNDSNIYSHSGTIRNEHRSLPLAEA